MAFASLALTLLPVVGLLLWIIKTVMKVSFSVIKVLAVLFVVWFVYVIFSGSLWQAIDGIGGPSVEHNGNTYTVNAAFSDGAIDLRSEQARVVDVRINGVASKLTLQLPPNTVVHIKNSGALVQTVSGDEEEVFLIGREGESQVYGSGTNIVQVEVVAAFCRIEIE